MSQTRSRQTLASILVDGGIVTQEQVDAAFQRQLETGRLIGETLVEMGHTSEENIGWGLSKQLGIPYVDIQTGAADLDLVRSFPETLLRQLQAAPLFMSQDEIVVAMSDPTDPDAVAHLKEAAGRSVALVIGCPSSIRRTLDTVFGPERESTARAARPSAAGRQHDTDDSTPAHRVVWERSGSSFVLYHVHAARLERASEIHFVPTSEGLAVLYRTDAGIEQKGVEHADTAAYLRSRLAHLGAGDLAPGQTSAWGHAVVEVGSDTTQVGVCHCRTDAGITTVLRLLPDTKEAADLSNLGLSPIGEAEIRDLVEGPEGIVIVHGPPRAGGTTVLASLAALATRSDRRTVVFEPWPVAPYPPDAARIPFGNASPGALDWERLAVGLGADVVVLDEVLYGESIRQVLSGATVGRLVFARTDWMDARRLLAFLAKSPNGRAVLRDRPFAMVALPAARREGSGAWTTPSESETQAGLLKATVDAKASDLHISVGAPPMARMRGEMVAFQAPPLESADTRASLYQILDDAKRLHFEEHHELDFAFELPGISRFRANYFEQRRGPAAVFRVIASKVPTLEDLRSPAVLRELASKERGLVLVTGPTGSGKSTTLAAMIDFINTNFQKHVITIEDPIEFVHERKKCLINQREVGIHTKSFASALRGALREDPDILLVGELRDLETTALAITAAETGHLVFGTLHTNSAGKTVDRLVDIFPADRQAQVRTMLSESLEGVVAQSLIPSTDGKGRVAAYEILIGVPALRNLIREAKTAQIPSVMQVGAQYGMITLDQSLKDLVTSGKITAASALARSTNPKLFESSVPGAAQASAAGAAGAARPARVGAPTGAS